MRLYLVRHGKALSESPTGRDRDRALAWAGQEQVRFLARELSVIGAEVVLSSPYARAWATAEPIALALGAALREEASLECDHPPSRVLARLETMEAESLVLVGHNPQLSDLVGLLARDAGEVRLRTGEAVGLECPGDLSLRRGEVFGTWRLEVD